MDEKHVSRRDFLKAAGAAGAAGGVIAGLAGIGQGAATDTSKAAGDSPVAPPKTVEKTAFAALPDKRPVDLYTLTAPGGLRVKVITTGATLCSLEVPDRDGKPFDVALGQANPQAWLGNGGSFGATIGRYGNRIGKAQFTLDGTTYKLAANNGANSIHGGREGFSQKLWTAEPVTLPDATAAVRLKYLSRDGEEGYPGNLSAEATYSLPKTGGLLIEYTATTDKPTVVNLVNHAYWNLGTTPNCLEHVLKLNADEYTVFDAGQIPTGDIKPVKGTPFDFTTATAIGSRIGQTGGGYDHNYVLRGKPGELRLIATIVDPKSGRTMDLSSDSPGVQFYTANNVGNMPGKNGATYGKYCGYCLETQRYPDSPNHANFPSAVLRPGETYRHRMLIVVSNGK